VTKPLTASERAKSGAPCCSLPSKRRPKDTKPYAALFKALADETRLEILGLLASAGTELCVCEIEEHVKQLSQPTISHHLRQLREAGLVTAERRATWVYYALDRATIARIKDFAALLGG
jgi:ArsR family transcriptional regulator, arsenate/arsenite/antimonite-responsive transcriptional repressor